MSCLDRLKVKYPQFSELELKEIEHSFDVYDATIADFGTKMSEKAGQMADAQARGRDKVANTHLKALINLEKGLNKVTTQKKLFERALHPNFHGNLDEAMFSVLGNTTRNVPNKFVNYENIQATLYNDYLDYANSTLDSIKGASTFLSDRDNQLRIFKYIWDGMTSPEEDIVKEIAEKVIAPLNSKMFDDLSSAGSYIGVKKDYIIPQTHKLDEITVRPKEWVEFMLENLNYDETIKRFDYSPFKTRSKELRKTIQLKEADLRKLRVKTRADKRPKTDKDSAKKREYEKNFMEEQYLRSEIEDLKADMEDIKKRENEYIENIKNNPNHNHKRNTVEKMLYEHLDKLRDQSLENRVGDSFGRRAFIFKNAESAFEYMEEFGYGNLMSTFYKNIEKTSKQTALVSVAGDTPFDNLDLVMRKLNNINTFSGKSTLEFEKTMRAINFIKGTGRRYKKPDSGRFSLKTASNISDKIITPMRYMSQLGSAPLTALNDLTNTVTTAVTDTGENVLSAGIRNSLNAMANTVGGKDKLRELAKDMGTEFDNILLDGIDEYVDVEGLVERPGGLTRAMNVFFKLSGMTLQTRVARATATQDAGRRLVTALNGGGNPQHTKQFLNNFGFTDKELGVLKQMARKGVVPNHTTLSQLGADLSTREKRNLWVKLGSYYNKNMGASSPNPGLNQMINPIVRADLPKDTIGRLIATQVSFYKKALLRSTDTMAEAMRASNPEGRLFSNDYNSVKNLAQVTAFGLVVSGLVASLKQLVKTGEVNLDERFVQETITNSGLASVGLEIALLATYNKDPNGIIKYIVGPSYRDLQQLNRTIRSLTGQRDFTDSDLKYIMRTIPGQNIWYIRAYNEHVGKILPNILTEPSSRRGRER